MDQARISTGPAHQVAPTARAKNAPAQSAADTDAAAASGGFLALMAALQESDTTTESAVTLLDDSAQVSPELEGDDPAALIAGGGIDPAGMAAGTPAQVGVAPDAPLPVQLPGGSFAVGDLAKPQDGLVAQTALLDAGAGVAEAVSSPAAGTAAGRGSSRAGGAALWSMSAAAGAAPAWGLRGAAIDHAAGARVVAAAGAGLSPTGDAILAGRAGAGADVSGVPKGVPAAFDLMAGAQFVSPGPAAALGGRGAEAGAGGASGQGSASAGAPADAPGSSTVGGFEVPSLDAAGDVYRDPSEVAAEEQLAEQVTYWVNQKTQNAELTLNRDGRAVEVSVSLTGNEAHVTFRSDEAETRELLDRSMAQLGDLLRGEGLILSGSSVGTSARDSASNPQRDDSRARDGARQARVMAAEPVAMVPRAGGAARAVDVFV